MAMACSYRPNVLTTIVSTTPLATSFLLLRTPATAVSFFSSSRNIGATFTSVELIEGLVSMPMAVPVRRNSLHVVAMAPRTSSVKARKVDVCGGSARQSVVADMWSGGVGRGMSRRFAGPVRAMGEETMWITVSSAVALVVAFAAFAALGGYLLSMGMDNQERGEEEKIEKLKEQGLYEKPEPTQYEGQGAATRIRKRRISEE